MKCGGKLLGAAAAGAAGMLLAVLAVWWFAPSLWSSAGVRVILVNRSGRDLAQVTVAYSGGTSDWPSLPDGETVEAVVIPKWESSLTVTFTDSSSGRVKSAPVDVYMESYSCGSVVVTVPPSLKVEYEDRTWYW